MENQNQMSPKTSWLLMLAVAAAIIVVGVTVYFFVLKLSLAGDVKDLTADLETINAAIATLETEQVDEIQSAKALLQKIQTGERKWSNLFRTIALTVPTHLSTQIPKVGFQSYVGSADGSIVLTGSTQPGSPDPYRDLSETVRAFADPASAGFSSAFITSVSRGLNEKGQIVLTFTLTLIL